MRRLLVLVAAAAALACGREEPGWLDSAAEAEAPAALDEVAEAPVAAAESDAPASEGSPPDVATPGKPPVADDGAGEASGAEPQTRPDQRAQTEQAAARTQRRVVFVDVRRPDEFAAGHVQGAIHIPHTELPERWRELEEYRDADVVLYCRTGRRSGIAEQILRQAGFQHLHNGGGLSDLARHGVPTVPCVNC